jgi:UDP-N-acetylglucosamine--N-acetylmuramyl-(pentapeptide) pyrophosphoryl-undecaprenol N-acetylglucosamine transferase
MESDLVARAGIDFFSVPAAGVHGVGLKRLPGNLYQLTRGMFAARKVLNQFRPEVMFFTGGYVAVPMAFMGLRVPTVLFIPDIEPGLALKVLSVFADRISVSCDDTREFLTESKVIITTGYPVRPDLDSWTKDDAYQLFDFSPQLPTLLVTGGSLGSLTINQALVEILPTLLDEMQVLHLTGKLTWPQFEQVRQSLSPQSASRYRAYPYLHAEMGAAFTIADLVVSRAGASSIGEYPHFGIPAILVPYPYAWRYQKTNADYLAQHGAALVIEDADLKNRLQYLVQSLIQDSNRRDRMKAAMQSLAGQDAAMAIADQIIAAGSSMAR